MSTVHEEYSRFMQWLRAAEASQDARRIAKVVQDNLDAVIPTVNNAGQRAAHLAPLLRAHLEATTDAIEATEADGAAVQLPWTRLKTLKVGPFRGFRREEQFDLSNNIVLFQGPNGSGKSSICEALEYALLGHVEEAAAKRIDSLDDYFANIHEREYVAPDLRSVGGADGVPVEPNAELLRFAIIEKNRIENFARLAARTPAQAGPLIASLFGAEEFNSFVGNFTANLDNNLSLARPKHVELTNKRTALAEARQTVDGNAAVLEAFNEEQEAAAGAFDAGLSYAQLLDRLGLNGANGRLQEITATLQEQIPPVSIVGIGALPALRKGLKLRLSELKTCTAALDARAQQVSFLALYRAVHAMQEDHLEVCPACETPLAQVTTNPFERAEAGLDLLRDLAELERQKRDLTATVLNSSEMIRTRLRVAHGIAPFDGPVLAPMVAWMEREEAIPMWETDFLTYPVWRAALLKVEQVEARDADIRLRLANHERMQEEARELEAVKVIVEEIRNRRTVHNLQVAAEQAKIDGFDVANADLIAEVEAEATKQAFEVRIQNGYASYLNSIKRYRDGLPEGLLADLNETTKDLYNLFNADDHENDRLQALTLPMRGGERIQVTLAGRPGEQHDALRLLSEGHLRCLGLAILLAKNIKLELPLLVFDDAVNAIDHDHRKGIRDTLFYDARLNTKQMIITCHSPEFITQVQNGLGNGVSKLYVLEHHRGDHQPVVLNGTDRHYVRRAEERLANGDQRQALASSRQALENLAARVWKSLANRDQALATVSLVHRGPSGEPDLRPLIDQLANNIQQGILQGRLPGPAWVTRNEAFQELINVPETTLAWRYLNKGTHDGDGEDFEVGIVRQIVSSLAKLSGSF